MNKLLAVRKSDILVANGNNKLLLRERGLTKLLKSPETKLSPRDKGLYISIHH